MLEELMEHIWKGNDIPEEDRIPTAVRMIFKTGREGDAGEILQAAFRKYYLLARSDPASNLKSKKDETVLCDVLDAFSRFPSHDPAFLRSCISDTLLYLWERKGLNPTPEDPKTSERLNFVLQLIDDNEKIKPYQQAIIKKTADHLLRADKRFIFHLGDADPRSR